MVDSEVVKWALADTIGETIWKAEYRRATGKERSIHWTEVAETDREKYRYIGYAIIEEYFTP